MEEKPSPFENLDACGGSSEWPLSPKIFLSYRRNDSRETVYHIYDRLVARYGRASVFVDIVDISVGNDFRENISEALSNTDIMLAAVGPQWLGASNGGLTRILDEKDPVRVEVEAALQAKCRIIPVLVQGAQMPKSDDVPESIREFVFLTAARIDTGLDFHHHIDRLIRSMDGSLGKTYTLSPWPPPENLRNRLLNTAQWPSILVFFGAAVMPFAWSFALEPPWPAHSTIVTTIIELSVLAFVYQYFRRSKHRRETRTMIAGAALLVASFSLYLPMFSQLTYDTPTTERRFAKGFVCTVEARTVYGDKCPNLGMDELKGAEYEAERLWTSQSVTAVKIGLFGLWTLAFVAMAMLAANLVGHLQLQGTRR
jgi:hypothetical protein